MAPTIRRSCLRHGEAGVTLIEMMLVVMIVALMAAISFPAITTGIDSVRLSSSADAIVALINRGANFADRRQQAVEVAISRTSNAIEVRSADNTFQHRLELPDGVRIEKILPENPALLDDERQRNYLLMPGGTVPRFGIQLINRRDARRIVRVDPVTGAPEVQPL